jgi:hypothetical protein
MEKENPTDPMPVGIQRKERLKMSLFSLVDNSQDSFKKVPSWKRKAPKDPRHKCR